jgi:hypothetical protein
MLHPASPEAAVDAVAHMLGHVLGVGSTWNVAGQRELVPGVAGGMYDYVGSHAARAAYELGFTASEDAAVPVEDQAGGGNAGSHWRERVFGAELMTSVMNFAPDPLSQITVGSLADLGWTVDPAGADPYAAGVPFAGAARTSARLAAARRPAAARPTSRGATSGAAPLTDAYLPPRFVAARSGRMTRLRQ